MVFCMMLRMTVPTVALLAATGLIGSAGTAHATATKASAACAFNLTAPDTGLSGSRVIAYSIATNWNCPTNNRFMIQLRECNAFFCSVRKEVRWTGNSSVRAAITCAPGYYDARYVWLTTGQEKKTGTYRLSC